MSVRLSAVALSLVLTACGTSQSAQTPAPAPAPVDANTEMQKQPSPQLSAQDHRAFDLFLAGYDQNGDEFAPTDQQKAGLSLAGGWCASHPYECFVNFAYNRLLGRSAFGDPGHEGWVQALRGGSLSMGQVWYQIRHSDEGCARNGC